MLVVVHGVCVCVCELVVGDISILFPGWFTTTPRLCFLLRSRTASMLRFGVSRCYELHNFVVLVRFSRSVCAVFGAVEIFSTVSHSFFSSYR